MAPADPHSGDNDQVADPDSTEGEPAPERQARAPWHFKVIVVGTVVYLGWRLYQGIGWLAHHIH